MLPQTRQHVEQTLMRAQRERDRLTAELADWEAFIQRARALLPRNAASPSRAHPQPRRTSGAPRRRGQPGRGLWTQVRQVLAAAKRPRALDQMAAALKLAPKDGRHKVRWAIKGHSDIFTRVAPGTYALAEWPATLKKAPAASRNAKGGS